MHAVWSMTKPYCKALLPGPLVKPIGDFCLAVPNDTGRKTTRSLFSSPDDRGAIWIEGPVAFESVKRRVDVDSFSG